MTEPSSLEQNAALRIQRCWLSYRAREVFAERRRAWESSRQHRLEIIRQREAEEYLQLLEADETLIETAETETTSSSTVSSSSTFLMACSLETLCRPLIEDEVVQRATIERCEEHYRTRLNILLHRQYRSFCEEHQQTTKDSEAPVFQTNKQRRQNQRSHLEQSNILPDSAISSNTAPHARSLSFAMDLQLLNTTETSRRRQIEQSESFAFRTLQMELRPFYERRPSNSCWDQGLNPSRGPDPRSYQPISSSSGIRRRPSEQLREMSDLLEKEERLMRAQIFHAANTEWAALKASLANPLRVGPRIRLEGSRRDSNSSSTMVDVGVCTSELVSSTDTSFQSSISTSSSTSHGITRRQPPPPKLKRPAQHPPKRRSPRANLFSTSAGGNMGGEVQNGIDSRLAQSSLSLNDPETANYIHDRLLKSFNSEHTKPIMVSTFGPFGHGAVASPASSVIDPICTNASYSDLTDNERRTEGLFSPEGFEGGTSTQLDCEEAETREVEEEPESQLSSLNVSACSSRATTPFLFTTRSRFFAPLASSTAGGAQPSLNSASAGSGGGWLLDPHSCANSISMLNSSLLSPPRPTIPSPSESSCKHKLDPIGNHTLLPPALRSAASMKELPTGNARKPQMIPRPASDLGFRGSRLSCSATNHTASKPLPFDQLDLMSSFSSGLSKPASTLSMGTKAVPGIKK